MDLGMAHEYPITDAQMDALADEALGPEPELDLPTMEAFEEGPSATNGARKTHRELSRRQRLLAGAPCVRDALSFRRKKAFLQALAQCGNVAASSAAAGWGKDTPYSIRKADKDFAKSWDYAVEVYGSSLELEAHRRAVHGVTKGVYGSLGKDAGTGLIGEETVYSDSLLQTLLKANMRAKYGDKAEVDVTTKGGVLHVPVASSDWERLAGAGQQRFRESEEE